MVTRVCAGGTSNNLLLQMLTELEREEGDIEVRDHRDAWFFMQAMDVCRNHLRVNTTRSSKQDNDV